MARGGWGSSFSWAHASVLSCNGCWSLFAQCSLVAALGRGGRAVYLQEELDREDRGGLQSNQFRGFFSFSFFFFIAFFSYSFSLFFVGSFGLLYIIVVVYLLYFFEYFFPSCVCLHVVEHGHGVQLARFRTLLPPEVAVLVAVRLEEGLVVVGVAVRGVDAQLPHLLLAHAELPALDAHLVHHVLVLHHLRVLRKLVLLRRHSRQRSAVAVRLRPALRLVLVRQHARLARRLLLELPLPLALRAVAAALRAFLLLALQLLVAALARVVRTLLHVAQRLVLQLLRPLVLRHAAEAHEDEQHNSHGERDGQHQHLRRVIGFGGDESLVVDAPGRSVRTRRHDHFFSAGVCTTKSTRSMKYRYCSFY
eukprot:Rhum_TRINITY_DN21399_c0_g1::Rhum_TRINITY_DN21399_c0_g1_i1::g.173730::m.173730